MNKIELVCPKCGASLSVEKDMKQAFCMYCGYKIIINNEFVYRKVDEARIKEAENERIRLEIELERQKNEEVEKARAERKGWKRIDRQL